MLISESGLKIQQWAIQICDTGGGGLFPENSNRFEIFSNISPYTVIRISSH